MDAKSEVGKEVVNKKRPAQKRKKRPPQKETEDILFSALGMEVSLKMVRIRSEHAPLYTLDLLRLRENQPSSPVVDAEPIRVVKIAGAYYLLTGYTELNKIISEAKASADKVTEIKHECKIMNAMHFEACVASEHSPLYIRAKNRKQPEGKSSDQPNQENHSRGKGEIKKTKTTNEQKTVTKPVPEPVKMEKSVAEGGTPASNVAETLGQKFKVRSK